MQRQIVLILLSLAVALGNVLELTDANFEDTIADHAVALVKFYAPWCGHCKRMAPEFDKASTILARNDPPVALIKVDCTVETTVCGKHGVSGYPTLKIFRGGALAEDYNGPREADGIVKHMRSKAGPTAKEVNSVADMEKFIDNPEHSIVGFFAGEDSEGYKNFKKLADALSEDFRFAYTFNNDVVEKFGFSDTFVIYRPKRLQNKFEANELKYEDSLALNKMKTFVNNNVHGMVGHKHSGNANQFQHPLITAYYDVDYKLNPKGTNYWRNRVLKTATKFSDKTVFFAVSDFNEFQQELSEFGIESLAGDKPIVTARDAASVKYVMSDEFSIDNLEKFVNDFLDGKIEPYLKSEPIPEDNDEYVKTVVAKNFDAIVNDEDRDVLMEFYAPWCGHCKNLAPKYEELAESLKGESGVTIAKMDATANDVPKHFQVQGFPTIYYVPADNKKSPKKYEGGREVLDFIKYLAKESTKPLSGFDKDGKKKKAEL